MALALPFALSACGDDSTGPDDDQGAGTFSATVSGGVSDSFSGQAFFGEGTDPDTDETGWVLWLTTSESETSGQAIYFVRQGTRPGTGTHSLADIENDELAAGAIGAMMIDYESDSFGGVFVSTGGSLVLSESDNDRMKGSFTIEASGFVTEAGEPVETSVTITGQFDGTGGNVVYPGL
jgi:hypothetical protein